MWVSALDMTHMRNNEATVKRQTCTNCTVQVYSVTNIMEVRCIGVKEARLPSVFEASIIG